MVGDDERADGIFRGDAAGVADHVSVTWAQAEAAFEKNSGIHAGENGETTPRLHGEIAQVETSYKFFVSFQQFVGD
jgi:hypothetical protein